MVNNDKYFMFRKAVGRLGHDGYIELNAIFNDRYQQQRLDELSTTILFLSVKAHQYVDKSYWDNLPAQQRFNTMSMELDLVKGMTPRQLMNVFPIAKQYNGRGDFKDYFTTMQMIKDYGMDRLIDEPQKFLFDYVNDDIDDYVVDLITTMSDLNQEQGKPGIMEQFLANGGTAND